MDLIRQRVALTLEYADPAGFLAELRNVEPLVAASGLEAAVRQLRTRELREWKQAREAALFCHGLSGRIGFPVLFGRQEAQDYDFVARCIVGSANSFLFVQLKEVVPPALNAKASVQAAIDGLEKYVDSNDLTVALYLNRPVRFDPSTITLPTVPLAGLWVFGAITSDRLEWALWGDLLTTREGTRFRYPGSEMG
jgi:hypothetical protein